MRLKELREKSGYTQKQLAEMLRTSQQTITRWENKKVEPNISALRDMALIFDVSIDFLVGNTLAATTSSKHHISSRKYGLDGYWGNIGLLHPKDDYTQWYPISVNTMQVAHVTIQTAGDKGRPMVVQTLNNRLLIFKPDCFERVWFLDEACDHIIGDWNVGPDCVEGMPDEFYRGLQSYYDTLMGAANWKDGTSDRYRDTILDYVKEWGADEGQLRRMLEETTIRTQTGRKITYIANASDIYSIASDCEDPEYFDPPNQFCLNSDFGAFESSYNWRNIALIDTPLIPYLDILNEELAEYPDD